MALCRLASEPPDSGLSCLSSFFSVLPPLLCPTPLTLQPWASAPGLETGPVVLKHPASEAAIQPLTQVTLRCHIDGHPR